MSLKYYQKGVSNNICLFSLIFGYIDFFLKLSLYSSCFSCRAPVDYELPDVPTNDIPLPEFPEEESVKVKFKEKRVTSLSRSGDVTAVAFKKRKVTKGARNVRSRDDSDE